MPIRAEVLKDRCISSGRCVGDEPSAFRFDADELVELLDGVTTMNEQRLIRIARDCPGEALVLYDDNNEVIELH